ncbi:BamA/TamA family outer membrane protein [candidate division KSB1 bacterium]|nr:BamA/TamA family outer membrane protein [candidate division KSB1 bacterium]
MSERFIKICFFCIQTLFFVAGASAAEPVAAKMRLKEIHFYGLDAIRDREAQTLMELSIDRPVRIETLPQKVEKLLGALAREGYNYSRLDSLVYTISLDSSEVVLRLYVDQAPQLYLHDLLVTGVDSSRIETFKSRFDSRPGREVNANVIESDLSDAIDRLGDEGFAFSRFDLRGISLKPQDAGRQGVDLHFNLVLGPELILEDIQIVGNTLTKKHVILREARIHPGEYFRRTTVDQIPLRLMRTGYFSNVEPAVVFLSDDDRGGLVVVVEEGPTSRFDGILGYNPATETADGYFTGLLDISLGNLFGTGRSLAAHWQKRDRKTQELEFSYREPWVAGFPLSIGFGFQQLIQDTTYVDRSIGFDFDLPILENLIGFARLSRREIAPDSIGSFILGIPSSRTWNAKVGFAFDTREDRINPRYGFYYRSSVEAGQKKNLGPESLVRLFELDRDIDVKRFELDVEWYVPLFKRQIAAISLHGRQLKSNENPIPVPDLYRLGGSKSLRGYREDQFLGTNVLWSAVEYRYWLGKRSRVFVFLDGGYYSRTTAMGKGQAFKTGYGIGFRLQTGLGVMGVDYGLGKGDDVMNGKLHISLINEF